MRNSNFKLIFRFRNFPAEPNCQKCREKRFVTRFLLISLLFEDFYRTFFQDSRFRPSPISIPYYENPHRPLFIDQSYVNDASSSAPVMYQTENFAPNDYSLPMSSLPSSLASSPISKAADSANSSFEEPLKAQVVAEGYLVFQLKVRKNVRIFLQTKIVILLTNIVNLSAGNPTFDFAQLRHQDRQYPSRSYFDFKWMWYSSLFDTSLRTSLSIRIEDRSPHSRR